MVGACGLRGGGCQGRAVFLFLLLSAASPSRAADVLTQHNDNARSGTILDETKLTVASVGSGNFGKLWSLYADGQVVAQPLYVGNLAVDTSSNTNAPPVKGTFNAVVIATMHNTVYVYDADQEKRGPDGRTIPLWAAWLGQPRPGTKDIDMWSTNDPEWGIVSTPVISDDKKILYVVAWHGDGPGFFQYKLHALDLKTGLHRGTPVVIGVPSTDPSRPCQEQSAFNPCTQKQRSALLLAKGVIYVAFGGDGNRGAVIAIDAQTLAEKARWTSTPQGKDGGLWQSGQGPAADADGNVYLSTGNGDFDAAKGNFGSSVVKLKLEGGKLVVKDYFTPCNFKFLNALDLDLGSSGPLLVQATPPRLLAGGKEGVLYSLQRSSLGKNVPPPAGGGACQNAPSVQQFLAFPPANHGGQTHYGNIHGSPVLWKGQVYVWGENSALKAFRFAGGKFQQIGNPKQGAYRPPDGMPGGMIAVSANQNKAGTGVVWGVAPLDGDANQQRGVKGIVVALDAEDISRTLWTSEQVPQRDRLGLFAKFANPLVAGGKVFVATYGDDEPRATYPSQPERHPTQFPKNYSVAVYGTPINRTVVNQDGDDVTLLRAVTGALQLAPTACAKVDQNTIDCTDALAGAGKAPSFHRVLVAAGSNLAGCSLLRVTTASKDAGLANAIGIGFYSATISAGNLSAEDAGRFVPKTALRAVGTATLASGAPATLHDFVGLTNCQTLGQPAVGRIFKPYMQFDDPVAGSIFRNWDLGANQTIDAARTQFDRSADVLRR